MSGGRSLRLRFPSLCERVLDCVRIAVAIVSAGFPVRDGLER